MNIPESYIIMDLRSPSEFKGVTISGYKKNDVINVFQNSLINSNIEDSLRWCVELHSSGLNKVIWDSLFSTYFRYIHINNPNLYLFLLKREKEYNKILEKYPPKKHELFTRNDQEIRHLFIQLTVLCTLSKKCNLFLPKSLPKVDSKFYNKEEIVRRMISKNLDPIYDYVPIQADSDTKLALNEIFNNLRSSKGTYLNCIYWHLWLEKVDSLKKKDKIEKIIVEQLKPVKDVDQEFWHLWIWNVWFIILDLSNHLSNEKKIFIKKMWKDYRNDFKPFQINRKKFIFFIIYYLFKNEVQWNIPLCNPKEEFLLIQSCGNINILYKEIKNYLENNLSHDDKNVLWDSYNALCSKFEENENQYQKPTKEPTVIQDTFITKIDPTRYPSLKPLSKLIHRVEEPTIEYHNIIQDQIKKVENDIEREIERGYKSRRLKENEFVEPRIERIKKRNSNESINEDDQNQEETKDYKLGLYTQFISYKNDNSPSNKKNNHHNHDSEPELKTINIDNRKRIQKFKSQSIRKNNYDDDDENDFDYDS